MVEPPKPETLRVLYMTANPEMDLRTEVEVRDVQQAVQRARHRELIDIQYRPAATPEDLLDGRVAREFRQGLLEGLDHTARRIDQREGPRLARQLAVLIDGAYLGTAHLGSNGPGSEGVALARQLIEAACHDAE